MERTGDSDDFRLVQTRPDQTEKIISRFFGTFGTLLDFRLFLSAEKKRFRKSKKFATTFLFLCLASGYTEKKSSSSSSSMRLRDGGMPTGMGLFITTTKLQSKFGAMRKKRRGKSSPDKVEFKKKPQNWEIRIK